MVNVSQSFGGLPVIWIRYNPDDYKAYGVTTQKTQKERFENLTKLLKYFLEKTESFAAFVQVTYLYFDGWKDSQTGELNVLVTWEN